MEIITNFAEALQANPALLVAISLWEALFTLLALWFAARNDHSILRRKQNFLKILN